MPDLSARHICETALELIGVAAADQPIDAAMAQRALQALNTMLDAWATERLLTYTRPRYVLPLVVGQGSYTWGLVEGETTPAEISAPVPVRLEIALLNIGSGREQEWPLHILTQDEYESGVGLKELQSSYPGAVYLEPTQPYAALHLYPVPTIGYRLILLPWTASSPYEHWDHALSWPNGYGEAFEQNLALRLAPRYGVQVSPDVRQLAEESKRALYPITADVGRLRLNPRRPVGTGGLGYPLDFLTGRG
jgi:hypothetical protein